MFVLKRPQSGPFSRPAPSLLISWELLFCNLFLFHVEHWPRSKTVLPLPFWFLWVPLFCFFFAPFSADVPPFPKVWRLPVEKMKFPLWTGAGCSTGNIGPFLSLIPPVLRRIVPRGTIRRTCTNKKDLRFSEAFGVLFGMIFRTGSGYPSAIRGAGFSGYNLWPGRPRRSLCRATAGRGPSVSSLPPPCRTIRGVCRP